MDPTRIDALTRFVAKRTDRRTLAAGVLAGLFSGLLPGFGGLEAGAARKNRRSAQRCKKPKRRCGKKCVNVKNHRKHCGKCNRTCGPDQKCRRGRCTPRRCGEGAPCTVFVTSTTHNGNLGGLAGADALCNQRASAAGLPGTYKAWLSTSTSAVLDRFTRNPGPYVRVDGTPIADSWADLTDASLLAPINRTEFNQAPSSTFVWTSTYDDGMWSGNNCFSWTYDGTEEVSWPGNNSRTDDDWADAGSARVCNELAHLYCFQQS